MDCDKLEILLFAQQMYFQNLHTQSHSPSFKKKNPFIFNSMILNGSDTILPPHIVIHHRLP